MSGFSFSASVLWQGTLCEPSAVGSQLHAQCCATARTPTSCCKSLGSQILQLTCSGGPGSKVVSVWVHRNHRHGYSTAAMHTVAGSRRHSRV